MAAALLLSFNTQPRRGGCKAGSPNHLAHRGFNTQPRGGGCPNVAKGWLPPNRFQHTAARRRLPTFTALDNAGKNVSTHSHPKVAALDYFSHNHKILTFNTQPPEGGCTNSRENGSCRYLSTHSHPKVAAMGGLTRIGERSLLSTHSHPKVAAQALDEEFGEGKAFNTQPPEGGCATMGHCGI